MAASAASRRSSNRHRAAFPGVCTAISCCQCPAPSAPNKPCFQHLCPAYVCRGSSIKEDEDESPNSPTRHGSMRGARGRACHGNSAGSGRPDPGGPGHRQVQERQDVQGYLRDRPLPELARRSVLCRHTSRPPRPASRGRQARSRCLRRCPGRRPQPSCRRSQTPARSSTWCSGRSTLTCSGSSFAPTASTSGSTPCRGRATCSATCSARSPACSTRRPRPCASRPQR